MTVSCRNDRKIKLHKMRNIKVRRNKISLFSHLESSVSRFYRPRPGPTQRSNKNKNNCGVKMTTVILLSSSKRLLQLKWQGFPRHSRICTK